MSDSLLSELMTAEKLAALLHMKRTTIEDYGRHGLLPSIKLGPSPAVRAFRRRGRAPAPTRRSGLSRTVASAPRDGSSFWTTRRLPSA
jgi:hypothetical protein